jgi:hypothetical protein
VASAIKCWPVKIGQRSIVAIEKLPHCFCLFFERLHTSKSSSAPDGFGEVAAVKPSFPER